MIKTAPVVAVFFFFRLLAKLFSELAISMHTYWGFLFPFPRSCLDVCRLPRFLDVHHDFANFDQIIPAFILYDVGIMPQQLMRIYIWSGWFQRRSTFWGFFELSSNKIKIIDNWLHSIQISDQVLDLLVNVSNLSPETIYMFGEAHADVDYRECTNSDRERVHWFLGHPQTKLKKGNSSTTDWAIKGRRHPSA